MDKENEVEEGSSSGHAQELEESEPLLTDLDLLKCPICVDLFTTPVYQCQNGHVPCSSCYQNNQNQCPWCSLPIGNIRCLTMDKVLEVCNFEGSSLKHRNLKPMEKEHEFEEASGSRSSRSPCPKRRKISATQWVVPEGSSESSSEEEEEDDNDLENQNVVLSNTDSFDCPICLDVVTSPSYQCENGHVVCSSCRANIRNKCPQCSLPFGNIRCRIIERLAYAVEVSCRNMKYGCREKVRYLNKDEHEDLCRFSPCSCPVSGCRFEGVCQKLYSHFSLSHASSAQGFSFDKLFTITLERSQRSLILREDGGTIYVLNHRNYEIFGSCINVVRIAPVCEGIPYCLRVSHEETKIVLNALMESRPISIIQSFLYFVGEETG